MKTCVVPTNPTKTKLSSLIPEACGGAAEIAQSETNRQPGSLEGKLIVGSEFFEPLPDDELSAWE